MPEYTYLAITLYRLFGPNGCFLHSIILMVTRKNLGITTFTNIKEDVVLQEVKQNLWSEDRLESHIIVSHLTGRLFPFHVAVFLCCDCAYFCERHITHHIESIVDEERRNEFLIVANLQIGLAGIGLFPAWRFQLNDHQRQTIHKHHYVRSLGIKFLDGELIHY